jgi:hypothetical protein
LEILEKKTMSLMHWSRPKNPLGPVSPDSEVSRPLRVASLILRAVFIASLVVVTLRVSMPQSETIWTAYETPADLIRIVLGVALCVWFAVQLLAMPKDAQAHRMWIYLGLAAVPFAVICIVGIW